MSYLAKACGALVSDTRRITEASTTPPLPPPPRAAVADGHADGDDWSPGKPSSNPWGPCDYSAEAGAEAGGGADDSSPGGGAW